MKKLTFSLIVFAFFINNVKAQNPLDDFTYQVYYKTTSNDPAVFDSLCTRYCKITLSDTTNISVIKVSIGTVSGANDILDYDFVFDTESGLPSGLSYRREQNNVYLGLFNTYQADMFYYEVQMEDSSGNQSVVKQWN